MNKFSMFVAGFCASTAATALIVNDPVAVAINAGLALINLALGLRD